ERFDIDVHALVGAVDLEPGLGRNVYEVVLGLAERAALLLGDAHHFVGLAIDIDGLPQGIHSSKEPLGHVGSNHGDVGAMLVVGLHDVASNLRLFHIDVPHVGRDPADFNILNRLGFVLDVAQAVYLQTYCLRQVHIVAEVFKILIGDLLVGALQLDEHFPARNQRELFDQKNIGSPVGHLVGYIFVGSVHHRGYDNKSG